MPSRIGLLHPGRLSRLVSIGSDSESTAYCSVDSFRRAARSTVFGPHSAIGWLSELGSRTKEGNGHSVRERRWRVNNNLPGTRAFCPIIRRSQALTQSLQFNPLEALTELDRQFGEDVLMHAAAWLTLKESRASFLIEREADHR
jgi:hypothetical protein